jgi:protein tyrosine/serine phosphatase
MGKDRTGIVVALLLALVGVPDAVIVEDYALSMQGLEPEFARWPAEEAPHDAQERARLSRMLRAEAATMEQTLAFLADRYGGAERYLRAGGLPLSDIAALRRRLTETGG